MTQETPFGALVERIKGILPEFAEGVRRNISDANLLRAAALEVLSPFQGEQIQALLLDLLTRRDSVVCTEVTALMVSLHGIDVDHAFAYLDERHPPQNYTLRYRFEGTITDDVPDWLRMTSSPRDYVLAIIAQAVSVHLLDSGDWERPACLAPSRRGNPRSTRMVASTP